MSTFAAFPVAAAKPMPAGEHAALVARMKAIVGNDNVLTATADLSAYECDGFTIAKTKPNVVFPTATEHIVGIVKTCNKMGSASSRAGPAPASRAGACSSAAA